jgi:ferredoxin
MSKKVTIDTDECIGCQTCVELCPEVFGFDNETEKAVVLSEVTGNEGCIDEAADACPASCITVEKE